MAVRPKYTVAMMETSVMHMGAVVVMPMVAFVAMRFSSTCTCEH